jgi:hypothetical protein
MLIKFQIVDEQYKLLENIFFFFFQMICSWYATKMKHWIQIVELQKFHGYTARLHKQESRPGAKHFQGKGFASYGCKANDCLWSNVFGRNMLLREEDNLWET